MLQPSHLCHRCIFVCLVDTYLVGSTPVRPQLYFDPFILSWFFICSNAYSNVLCMLILIPCSTLSPVMILCQKQLDLNCLKLPLILWVSKNNKTNIKAPEHKCVTSVRHNFFAQNAPCFCLSECLHVYTYILYEHIQKFIGIYMFHSSVIVLIAEFQAINLKHEICYLHL